MVAAFIIQLRKLFILIDWILIFQLLLRSILYFKLLNYCFSRHTIRAIIRDLIIFEVHILAHHRRCKSWIFRIVIRDSNRAFGLDTSPRVNFMGLLLVITVFCSWRSGGLRQTERRLFSHNVAGDRNTLVNTHIFDIILLGTHVVLSNSGGGYAALDWHKVIVMVALISFIDKVHSCSVHVCPFHIYSSQRVFKVKVSSRFVHYAHIFTHVKSLIFLRYWVDSKRGKSLVSVTVRSLEILFCVQKDIPNYRLWLLVASNSLWVL